MYLNWYQGILYGIASGLADILPVSSQAHRFLLLKLFGGTVEPELLRLLTDLGILAALYFGCQNHIIRIIRSRRLARVPKKRRKRPLDTKSLMDESLLKTMVIPVILVMLLYGKIRSFGRSMIFIAFFLFLNGVILYLPQFFPSANRDSRNMTRVHGLLIGLGGTASVIPGLSGIAAASSVSSVCGVEGSYGINMTLLMHMFTTAGFVVHDVLALINMGTGDVSFGSFVIYLLAAASAFGSATLAIRILRRIAAEAALTVFAFYCWGIAMFTFVVNLVA